MRRNSMSSCGSSGYFPTLSSSPPVLCSPKSVLRRPVTSEELLTPGAPYARKTLKIVGDAVSWGFVVQGSKPCHIQAVDPSGHAAAAEMKVCQFVDSVNGLNVLNVDYRTVSNLILTGPRTMEGPGSWKSWKSWTAEQEDTLACTLSQNNASVAWHNCQANG